MRAIVCSALMALTITTAGAQAQGCTRNHELYRIVSEHRAIMLDGGDIKRVMFVDWKDERLKTWKPGHNITFCPDENKMINTTINSIATLLSEFAATTQAGGNENILRGDPTHLPSMNQLGWYVWPCC